MVLRTVNLSDTIDQWKNQHNSLATDVGDLSLLNTTDSSSIVAAINSLIGEFDSANIITLARSSLSGGTGITYSSSTGVITLNIPSSTVTSAMIVNGTIVNDDINASAAIVDTKLATIATAGKVSNSATTATSANTASAIVARDASGNFTAGTITAALTGNASTATTLATGRNFSIDGDITAAAISFNGSGAVALSATIDAGVVTSTKLASAVTLIIYNSAGSAVKTLYGAGE